MRLWPGMSAGTGLLVFLFLLSSCATGAGGGPTGCRSNLSPHERSLNELVDSTALQSHLEAIWTPVDGLVLGWIRFDSTGAKDRVGIRTESLSQGQRIRMEEALSSAVVSTPGRKSGTNIFIGDERGPAVRRLSRVEACRPEIRNQEMLSKGMEEAGRKLGLRETRQAILQAYVLEDGTVGDVRVDRSSGDPGLDLAAAEVLRSAVFTPALIEGIRVPVWVQLPMVFRPPRRGGGGAG